MPSILTSEEMRNVGKEGKENNNTDIIAKTGIYLTPLGTDFTAICVRD